MNVDASAFPSGVDFYKIVSAGFVQTRKMLVTK